MSLDYYIDEEATKEDDELDFIRVNWKADVIYYLDLDVELYI